MPDLLDELRRYGDAVESAALDRQPQNYVAASDSTRYSRSPRRLIALAATAVVLVVVLVSIAVAAGDRKVSPRVGTPPTATDSPDSTQPDPMAWPASRCGEPQPTLVVYLQTDASPSEIDQISHILAAADGVDSSQYVDQEASYAEFKELFADSPEMVASVTPRDLLSSFRVITSQTVAQTLIEDLQAFPVVKNTVTNPCSPQPKYSD